MNCRPGCGACCTAPSISSAIPGMPTGKPAGVRCVQLDEQERCRLFGRSERPAVCGTLMPTTAMCGESRTQAMSWISRLERRTQPTAFTRGCHSAGHKKMSNRSTIQSCVRTLQYHVAVKIKSRRSQKKAPPMEDGAKHTIARGTAVRAPKSPGHDHQHGMGAELTPCKRTVSGCIAPPPTKRRTYKLL